jgi:hypothetical protein
MPFPCIISDLGVLLSVAAMAQAFQRWGRKLVV